MTTTRIIIIAILSVFSFNSYSVVGGIRPSLNLVEHDEEDCAMKSRNGGAAQLSEISDMLHQASYREGQIGFEEIDRSNPVDVQVMQAMATVNIAGAKDQIQSVQICEGVFVSSAHGFMNRDFVAMNNSNPIHLVAYPYSRENAMVPTSFISPRLDGTDPAGSHSTDESTDFIFIKVENSVYPQSVLRPVNATSEDLQYFDNNGQMGYYKPPHPYENQVEVGGVMIPDFNSERRSTNDALELYDEPIKVVGCDYNVSQSQLSHYTNTTCPGESRSSSSPITLESDGVALLAGIHQHMENTFLPEGETQAYDNYMRSEAFCEYVERDDVCGQPCVEVQELMQNQNRDVSI